jgi:hypothetical protein
MEAIDVELSDFSLRCRSLAVSHLAASLPRGLEPGEQVVLHDRARGYFTAHVADFDFEPHDTVYRMTLGVRISREEAHGRILGRMAPAPGPLTKQDLLDLLGQLRASDGPVPVGEQQHHHGCTDTAL